MCLLSTDINIKERLFAIDLSYKKLLKKVDTLVTKKKEESLIYNRGGDTCEF